MKVVHVKNPQQRDACLARLCAEAFGRDAGLAPLVTFTGTLGVLVEQEAARVLALVDDDARPVALALLTLDREGTAMTVMLLAELSSERVAQPAQRLVHELALKAPLRVDATDDDAQQRFREAGITRWLDGENGLRIGLSARHPARTLADLPKTLAFDERGILQSFKRDRALFDTYKQRFIRGLESFPDVL